MRDNASCRGEKDREKMKVNAVILNYNDADTVETLVRSICGYEVLEYIILVDNHSQADSRQ